MVSVERSRSRSRKSGYPGKSNSNIPVDKAPTVNNYYVGSSRHDDYSAINEERSSNKERES
jgi:hypothetical protein